MLKERVTLVLFFFRLLLRFVLPFKYPDYLPYLEQFQQDLNISLVIIHSFSLSKLYISVI